MLGSCSNRPSIVTSGRVLLTTVLSLWRRAHFRTRWSLFVAGAGETSCFGSSKSTFRDRFGAVLLRNAVFVGGAALWTRSSDFVTGAVNRDFWICGLFADFVAVTALGERRSANFAAGTALGEPRSADFVAGTALCEPRSADFVAGPALCEPRSERNSCQCHYMHSARASTPLWAACMTPSLRAGTKGGPQGMCAGTLLKVKFIVTGNFPAGLPGNCLYMSLLAASC